MTMLERTIEAAAPIQNWYAARAIGRETRAVLYLKRAGLTAYWPEIHKYFVDSRTKVEKFRVAAMFSGYVFFAADSPEDIARASATLGVAYILGEWVGDSFRAKRMPLGWMEKFIENGPLIEGRRKKFCNGERVRTMLDGLTEMIGTVERQRRNGSIDVRMPWFGASRVVNIRPDKVREAGLEIPT